MIGTVESPAGTYTLGDDGKWQGSDDIILLWLNLECDPARETGVGCILPFGYAALYRASLLLKGEAIPVTPLEPLPEGVIS